MRGRKIWCKIQAPRGEIRVYATKNPIDVDGHAADAYFDPETNVIEVAVGPETTMKMKLLHELLHVIWSDASGDLREKVLGAKTQQGRYDREELVVSFQDAPLYDILTRNGWLKFPKPPRIS